MLGRVQMVEYNKDPVADSTDEVAGLARVAPHLELKAVAANLVKVFDPIEPQLLLPVVPAMIIVEKEVVVGGDGGETVRIVVR